jgi:RND family efflux transporter MFP subunit
MLETGPVAAKKKPKRRARLVEVVPAEAVDVTTMVQAMGTVQPSREVVLLPRVSGEVIEVSERFVPGGRFDTGDVILRIDPRDYELMVKRRESELAAARADLELEQGNQEIARREYELLGEKISEEDRALVLRKPQLAKVRAQVELAETALAEAKLALTRTVVRAPFPCLVRDRGVNLGTRVGTGTAIATLLDADRLWVLASVPVDRLDWIRLPGRTGETGAPARIFDTHGDAHPGTVLGLTGELEPQGRMARVLVGVDRPEGAADPGILIGSYLRVEIEGRRLSDVVALEGRLVHDGDTVWVMDPGDRLDLRRVEVEFRERERVYISSGLDAGERVVASDLASPVQGMPLRLNGDGGGGEGEGAPDEASR